MVNVTKEIFGKSYQFVCQNDHENALVESVLLYPDSSKATPDVIVSVASIHHKDLIARNPAILTKVKDGIITQFPECTVFWDVSRYPKQIICQLDIIPSGGIRKMYSRFRSMEYATDVEFFEQILHELVLVPSVYFLDGLSLIHAAAFAVDNRAVLLAGTGGTGKTSALLALRKRPDVSFISDDIAVVSRDGFVYPNLAWPKVYGYNLSDYITREELLKGRGAIDRIQFGLKLRRNPKSVRRKVRPDRLYHSFNNTAIPMEKIFYLFRDDSPHPVVNKLPVADAVNMGLHVIKTEYAVFNNFLAWDQYNAIATGTQPVLYMDQVFRNWEAIQTQAFKSVTLNLIHIPVTISHAGYLDYIGDLITG